MSFIGVPLDADRFAPRISWVCRATPTAVLFPSLHLVQRFLRISAALTDAKRDPRSFSPSHAKSLVTVVDDPLSLADEPLKRARLDKIYLRVKTEHCLELVPYLLLKILKLREA